MPREITTHLPGGMKTSTSLTLEAADKPGFGGANHQYSVTHCDGPVLRIELLATFQNGPVKDGINGITNEVLLAIVADRLEGFEAGPFACNENADALAHVQNALRILHQRTAVRIARGVHDTHNQ